MSFKVPFDGKDQQTWNGHGFLTEVEPYEFEDTLRYITYERGRSALNIRWKSDKTGKTYVSGMPMLHEILSGVRSTHEMGFDLDNRMFIKGKFDFKKQGTSVLLKLAK